MSSLYYKNKMLYYHHLVNQQMNFIKKISTQEFEKVLKLRFDTVLLYGQKLTHSYDIKKSTLQI